MSVMRLKLAFEPTIGGVWGDEPKGDANDMVCVRAADFDDVAGRVSEKKLTLRNISPSEQRGRVLRSGDILLEKSGGGEQTAVGRAVLFDKAFPAVCSNFMALLRPRKGHSPEYLAYLLHSRHANRATVPHIKQTTGIQNLDSGSYLSESHDFPDLAEQRRIAAWLDEKTAKIDRLIELRWKQIALLDEQLASVIQQAVTRGLNPSVQRKPSGLDWLGEIPANWQVKRLKFFTPQVTVGIVINPSSHYVERGIPCLRSLNVSPGMLTEENLVFINENSHRLLSKSAIHKGDLVAVRTGQPGTTAVVDDRFDNANCIDLIIIRQSRHFESEYLQLLLNSQFSKAQFESDSDGAIQQHFNIQTAKNLTVVLPPVDEQREVLAYLQCETSRHRSIADAYRRQIALLTDYRASIIHEAVTGQIWP